MRTLKPLISLISGLLNVSFLPKTIYCHVLRHQDTSNNPRNKTQLIFENIFLGKFKLLEIVVFEHLLVRIWSAGLLKQGCCEEVLQKTTFHRNCDSDDFEFHFACLFVSFGTFFMIFGATGTDMKYYGFPGLPGRDT